MFNPKVSQAVAAVLALGAAAGAQAVDITTVSPSNVLYVSGSTAIDPGLVAYATNPTDLVCNGNIDFYQGTSVTNGKFIAVACTSGAGLPDVPAGTPIAIIKEDNAGSRNGIDPVNQPAVNAVYYPVLSTLTTTNCGAGTVANPAGEQTQTQHTCTGYTAQSSLSGGKYSNLGFADVEAAIFGADTTNLNAISTVDVPFGVGVSLGLYHELQAVEGLTVGADDVADMPTLSRTQIAALFNGTISNWSTIKSTDGSKSVGSVAVTFGHSGSTCYDGTKNSTAADCTAPPAVLPSTTSVFFCERGQTSGTQQTAQIFFGNIGCASGVAKFSLARPSSCSTGGCGWSTTTYQSDPVFAGNGTGDDLSCLEGHDQGGQFAISFAGTDQAWGADATNTARADWRFIRIDGVVPSNENVAAGRYNYWAQSAGYYPISTSAVNYPAAGTVAAGMVKDFTQASTQIGTVASILALDPALQRTAPAFDGGLLNIPGNGGSTPNATTATLAQFRQNPVNSYLKENPSNNCQQPYLAPNAPDASNYPTWAGPN